MLPRIHRALALAVMAASIGCARAAEPAVLVVWTSGVAPFEEALGGLRSGMNEPLFAVDLKSSSADTDLDAALRRMPRLVIAMGASALGALKTRHYGGAVLATMILRADIATKMPAIFLDVPPAEVALRLRALFPGKARLGVIRNPARDPAVDPAWAKPQGFLIEPRDCASPEMLLKTFLSMKRKADFVLLEPDASLYNEATVRPLLMASIENQLPVIGFSASFVRAGAALGIYPDFQDVGAQTADAAKKFLAAGSVPTSETPRKLVVAVNQSVLRLVGLEYKTTAEFPLTVIK